MIPLRDNIPTVKPPVITVALIVANVLAYFLWQRGGLRWATGLETTDESSTTGGSRTSSRTRATSAR